MAEEPGDKTTPTTPDEVDTTPGQLGKDDRGNVTWEWADSPDLQADGTLGDLERVSALVDPSLGVLEEDASPDDPRAVTNSRRLKTGYNPYNSGTLGKQEWKKKRDLAELSKWIELRRKLAAKPGEE